MNKLKPLHKDLIARAISEIEDLKNMLEYMHKYADKPPNDLMLELTYTGLINQARYIRTIREQL